MSNDRKCSLCKRNFTSDEPAVLTMSAYGNPRYICQECEELFDKATLGTNFEEINEAMSKIGTTLADHDNGDETVFECVSSILESAGERAEKIKNGSYDFTEDEREVNVFDEIPEELRESEEDKVLDERENSRNKIIDKITSWVCAAILVGTLAYILIRFIIL